MLAMAAACKAEWRARQVASAELAPTEQHHGHVGWLIAQVDRSRHAQRCTVRGHFHKMDLRRLPVHVGAGAAKGHARDGGQHEASDREVSSLAHGWRALSGNNG
jgi:hypothetical protein